MNPADDRTPTEDAVFRTGLCLVHGNRPEQLRDLLLAWLRRDPLAPLEDEIVLVQSAGVAQWLRMGMAADPGGDSPGLGVCAAARMLLPSEFLWSVYRSVLGTDQVAAGSPLDKEALTWRLMRLLPAVLGQPCFEPVAQFLAQDPDLAKRFQLSERLADLFDQYQIYRSDWLQGWEHGDDTLTDARGRPVALARHQAWQPQLWREILADVRRTHGGEGTLTLGGRAAVHRAFLDHIATIPHEAAGQGAALQPPPAGLPRRILMFGVSSLPRQAVEVLAALSRWSQVFVCVNNPCQYYWADAVPEKDLLRASLARHPRRPGAPAALSDDALHLHTHPLLAQWGRQGRDFIGLLSEFESDSGTQAFSRSFAAAGLRLDCFDSANPGTLLGQLQDDILHLRPLHETRARWGAVDAAQDESIRFHVVHGAQREVEVLHDQLLAAFNADPRLRARDIVVMVPDVAAYTAHFQAVFGRLNPEDPRHIPFSFADRPARETDPLLTALERLLAIGRARLRVSEVLGLLETPALRRRFGIAQDELPLLQQWIAGAQIRWGLDGAHREALELPAGNPGPAPNTWAAGLRRMMLGYAAGDSGRGWHDTEPYAEVGGLAAGVLGPLVELVECLEWARAEMAQRRTPQDWLQALNALLERFFQADDGPDAYTLLQLQSALQRWEQTCEEAGLAEPLPLPVVAEHWLSQLDGAGLSRRFFGGAVTVATLMPMRAIPFRHVYLLGMNDGDYPRSRVPMDFDLMGHDYRPGDRSRREDDRYLFLEALLSARERLTVSWVGRSITDNTPRPPSVLVAQLRDHLDAGWPAAGGGSLCEALTTQHRLQPFSPDYFRPAGEGGTLFTYAAEWLEAVSTRTAPAGVPAAGATGDTAGTLLPPLPRDEPLLLRELIDFLRQPVREFFRRRLGVFFDDGQQPPPDDEPFELDGLQVWALQDELIRAQLSALEDGAPDVLPALREARLQGMRRAGVLPAGAFGVLEAERIDEPMAALFDAYLDLLGRYPDAGTDAGRLDESFCVDGVTLRILDELTPPRRGADGAMACIFIDSSALVDGASRYRLDKAVRYWILHLGAQIAFGAVTTHALSRKGRLTLAPVDPAFARAWLGELVAAWWEGMRTPLPLSVAVAAAWLPAEDDAKAAQVYEGGFQNDGVLGRDPSLRRAYPDYAALTKDGSFYRLSRGLVLPIWQALRADTRRAPADASGA